MKKVIEYIVVIVTTVMLFVVVGGIMSTCVLKPNHLIGSVVAFLTMLPLSTIGLIAASVIDE